MFFKLLLLTTVVTGHYNGKQAMRSVAETFGRTAYECQDEMNFDSEMLEVIFRYWHGEPLKDKDVGCMFRCILLKLELVDQNGRLHDANADGFFKANGADDGMTSKLLKLYHYCYQSMSATKDGCMLILEIGKCCREGVMKAHLSPVLN